MTRLKTLLFSSLAAGLLLLSGCSQNPDQDEASCRISLVAHSGTSPLDRQIRELHQRLQSRRQERMEDWERLGWLFVAKARESFDEGYYNMSRRVADCMQARQPDSNAALLLLGHSQQSLHQFEGAERTARLLVERRGISYDYGLLGDVLLDLGRLQEAAGAYQEMMDQKPGPKSYARAAHLRWMTGDLEGAAAMMALAAGAESPRDAESAAWAWSRLAYYQWQLGDAAKAVAVAGKALEWQPAYPPALLVRGRIRLQEGRLKEALEDLRRATELNPLPEYRWALIEALRSAGQTDTAATVEAAMTSSGSSEDPRTLSLYLATMGKDTGRALELARQELRNRQDPLTHDAVAWALTAHGKTAEALPIIERATRAGTRDARLFLHAFAIASEAGDERAAGHWLQQLTPLKHTLQPSEKRRLDQVLATTAPKEPKAD